MTENEHKADDKPQDPSERLDAVLKSAEEKGKRIAGIGRAVAKAGQEMADVAGATRNLVHIVKIPPNLESLMTGWEDADYSAGVVLAKLDDADIPVFLARSGSTLSTSSDTLMDRAQLFKIVPVAQHTRLVSAITDLSRVLERSADEQEVAELMNSLGLDRPPAGEKSALELFVAAHEAYAVQVTDAVPAATSLIPMRESIRQVILSLLRRRPMTEKTSSEWSKIVSIGSQLKYDGVPQNQVSTWAFQWDNLLKYDLSRSKKESITRGEWRLRLVRSTLFLKSLLSGIDPAKLR